jgi:hypothetical protein
MALEVQAQHAAVVAARLEDEDSDVRRVAVEALVWLDRDRMPFLEPNFSAVFARRLDVLRTAASVVHVVMCAISSTKATWFYARVLSLWREISAFLYEVSFDPCYVSNQLRRQGFRLLNRKVLLRML